MADTPSRTDAVPKSQQYRRIEQGTMSLRHLRYFQALAEELHFGRAAERLHIEVSPLSRAIQVLEDDLGVALFIRSNRGTRLTPAGATLLEHIPSIFAAVEQARASVQDVAAGYRGELRVALSDGLTPARLVSLMALCREEDPDIAVHFSEVPLAQQLKGLEDGLYDLGFAQSDDVGHGIVAEPAWHDPVHVVLPIRHPLLAMSQVPLEEILRQPLVLGDPRHCAGCCRQIDRLLRTVPVEPLVAERVRSVNLMLTMVAAGLALALVGASQAVTNRELGIVTRPLAEPATLTTWLLRSAHDRRENVIRFIERVKSLHDPESIMVGIRELSDP